MTPNPHDERPSSASDDGPPDAPQHVQDQVSALLRRSAQEPAPAMPSDVEARLRAALSAEFGSAFTTSATHAASDSHVTPAVQAVPDADAAPGAHAAPGARPESNAAADTPRVVALPARRVKPAHDDPDATRAADADERGGRQASAPQTPGRTSADGAAGTESSQRDTGATVVSLADRRGRRKRIGGAVIALGAAAAIAFGVVTMTQSNGHDAPVADPGTSTTGGVTQNYASRVRVTQTETKYSEASLVKQASALPQSKAPEVPKEMGNAQSLGTLSTGDGVQGCLNAVAPTLSKTPDRVYADFGTYEGQRAVVIVAQTGGKSTVWVVSTTCSVHSDLKAGPKDLTT